MGRVPGYYGAGDSCVCLVFPIGRYDFQHSLKRDLAFARSAPEYVQLAVITGGAMSTESIDSITVAGLGDHR